MIDIYWTNVYDLSYENVAMSLIQKKPISLLKDLKENELSDNKDYFLCPATSAFFKNTYVIKSPLSVDLDILDSEHPFIRKNERDDGTIDFELKSEFLFFSEHPVKIEVTPAYMHRNDLTLSTTLFCGAYDISKWFRPVHAGVFLRKNKIEINRGDAIFYVRFNTDENVKLKHFEPTREIQEIANSCVMAKSQIPFFGLKNLYSMFTERKRNKVLIKHIKNNLTGY